MPPRTKRPNLSSQLRGAILELHSLGWSLQKITTQHRLANSTVQDTITKANERSITQKSAPRQGAPRVISEDERDALFEAMILNPKMTYEALQAQEAPNASVRSIKGTLSGDEYSEMEAPQEVTSYSH